LALSITYYTYDQIRAKADEVLADHNPTGTIPVPVESIVEFDYEIGIIPIPGLKEVYEIDAFTGKNRTTIHVDSGVFESRSPFRYRFSLAHELGHIVLHREVYDQIAFSSINEWKSALRQIPENRRNTLEFQAYDFAGLVLVPTEQLRAELAQSLKVLERASESKGTKFDLQAHSYVAKPYICTRLSKHFAVSDQVIEKRLTKECLWPPR
jgi:hypothetical protein